MLGVRAKKVEYYRQTIRNETELFTSRVNLFFVAEAMLFVSYVTSLNLDIPNRFIFDICGFTLDIIPGLLICLGVITAIIFLFVLIRHAINNNETKKELEKIDSIYKEIFNIRKKRFGSADVVLSHLLPGTFFFAWWILWYFTVKNIIVWILLPLLVLGVLYGYQCIIIKNHRKLKKRKKKRMKSELL